MLPFVFLDESKLGPFHAYGIACMLAFFAWDHVLMRQAERRGQDLADFRALSIWILVVGTFTAWVVDAVFYHPPGRSVVSTLLAVQGFSSTGGIVGAVLGGVFWRYLRIGRRDGRLFAERRSVPQAMLPPAEIIVSTWPVGWAFGRLGCALIHDHPGIVVPKGTFASLFALAWPTGPEDGTHHVFGPLHVVTGGSMARFDLGFLELIVLTAIALGFARTWKRPVALGTYTIVGALVYGPIRFGLDFLRPEDGPGGDLRHLGLTFAQYFSVAIVGIACWLLFKRSRPVVAASAAAVLLLAPSEALAAPRWADRPMTLPKLVFAGDVGLGIAHRRLGGPDPTGLGLNLEGAIGVTDKVELGLRTGLRLGDDGRLTGADAYGRTLWTETYGTGGSAFANPEARVRWTFYRGSVTEIGLDGRLYLPFESGTRVGAMIGVPFAFHAADFLRIDLGVYIPVLFFDDPRHAIVVPAYFWFQPSEKLWLGPTLSLRSYDPGRGGRYADLLLGFGLGYQVAASVDIKTMLLFPRIDDSGGANDFGAGVGVQFRIGE